MSIFGLNSFGHYNSTPELQADSLFREMTFEEKVGQLNQYTSDCKATDKITAEGDKATQIRQGKVCSILNVVGTEETKKLQELALQSHLYIPMISGLNIIHGFRTTFPILLGKTATCDLTHINKSAHKAAT